MKDGKLSSLPDVEEVPAESQTAFEDKYLKSRAGVFHYDGDIWDDYETKLREYDALFKHYSTTKNPETHKLDTFNAEVIAKLAELRQLGDSLEGMFFCSYRKGYGPTGMKPNKSGYLMTEAEFRSYVDPRKKPMPVKVVNGAYAANFDNLFSYLHGNNNTLINRINTASDGPNFTQPSFVAGIDGYMQNADWLQARMNLTTDQGWGYLKQITYREPKYYITQFTGSYQFETRKAAEDSLKAIGKEEFLHDSIMPVLGTGGR